MEAWDWAEPSSQAWYRSLTEGERAALDDYLGFDYSDVNNRLRGIWPMNEDVEEKVRLLDGALSRGSVPDDIIVYRGLSSAELHRELSSRVGGIWEERGYTSASLRPYAARQFAGSSTDTAVTMDIKVPKGSRGAFIDSEEVEILIPRGSRYRIVGTWVDPDTGRHVAAELIP